MNEEQAFIKYLIHGKSGLTSEELSLLDRPTGGYLAINPDETTMQIFKEVEKNLKKRKKK